MDSLITQNEPQNKIDCNNIGHQTESVREKKIQRIKIRIMQHAAEAHPKSIADQMAWIQGAYWGLRETRWQMTKEIDNWISECVENRLPIDLQELAEFVRQWGRES